MRSDTQPDTLKEAAKAASYSSYQTQACTTYCYECAAGDNPHTTPFTQTPALDTAVSYTAQGHTQRESSSQWEKNY